MRALRLIAAAAVLAALTTLGASAAQAASDVVEPQPASVVLADTWHW